MDKKEAREQVAWLMRKLELVADGAGDIQLMTGGKPATKEQTKVWAALNAEAIRTTLEAAGLSTAWHSDED
jgi:hypothetical protein